MKKFYVMAKKWDDEKKDVVEYIAGTFDTWVLASIFRDAYNMHFSANARIAEQEVAE